MVPTGAELTLLIPRALGHLPPVISKLIFLTVKVFIFIVELILVPIVRALNESKIVHDVIDAGKGVAFVWYAPYLIPLLTAIITLLAALASSLSHAHTLCPPPLPSTHSPSPSHINWRER